MSQHNQYTSPTGGESGGVVPWVLLWAAGIAAILFYCVEQHWSSVSAKLQTQVETAVTGVGITDAEAVMDARDVLLRGQAESAEMRSAAALAAGNVEGIQKINNQISVASAAALQPPTFSMVSTEEGLTLSGRIPSDASAELLIAGIDQSYPTLLLTNNIVVDAETAEPDWLESTLQSLVSLKSVRQPELHITGDVVRVLGFVDSTNTADLVMEDMSQRFVHPLAISNELVIQPPAPLIDPELTLRQVGSKLIISGIVRTKNQQDELTKVAMTAFDVNQIENQLLVEPETFDAIWLDSALTLLPTLGTLDGLYLSIMGNAMTVEAVAPTEDARAGHLLTINNTVGGLLDINSSISVAAKGTATIKSPTDPTTDSDILVASSEEPVIAKATARQEMGEQLSHINLAGIAFGAGSATLATDSHTILDEVAEVLASYPNRDLNIIGHGDTRGDLSGNLKLAQSRAEAIRSYLLNRGIAAARLQSSGYDDSLPADTNSTQEARAGNQRIEFKF